MMSRILKLMGMAVTLVGVLSFVAFSAKGAYGMILGIFIGSGALILGVLLIVTGLIAGRGSRRSRLD